jgi:hypothetical protein
MAGTTPGHETEKASPRWKTRGPPDGRIDTDFDRRRARRSLSTHENHLRQKTNFSNRFNPIPPVQSCREKYSAFVFSEIDASYSHPALERGAFRDRHERWAREAVDASGLQRAMSAQTNNTDADGQAAWSWHPDADVKVAVLD